jgi:hypothetical protein
MAQPALHGVAHHRTTDGPAHDETHPNGGIYGHIGGSMGGRAGVGGGPAYGRFARDVHGEQGSAGPSAAEGGLELLAPAHPLGGRQHGALLDCSGQADSSERPLRRRAVRIARPARVRMRARNPCVRARRRLLGWKVRFTVELQGRAAPSGAEERCGAGVVLVSSSTVCHRPRRDLTLDNAAPARGSFESTGGHVRGHVR